LQHLDPVHKVRRCSEVQEQSQRRRPIWRDETDGADNGGFAHACEHRYTAVSCTVMSRGGYDDENLWKVTKSHVTQELFSHCPDDGHPTDRDELVTAIRALDVAEDLLSPRPAPPCRMGGTASRRGSASKSSRCATS
jgi:hypothetical protein